MGDEKMFPEEEIARDFWYEDDKKISYDELHKLGKPVKVYYFGKYRDVELWKFKNCAVVIYVPTNTLFYFDDIDRAFDFARDRARHANAIAKLFGF